MVDVCSLLFIIDTNNVNCPIMIMLYTIIQNYIALCHLTYLGKSYFCQIMAIKLFIFTSLQTQYKLKVKFLSNKSSKCCKLMLSSFPPFIILFFVNIMMSVQNKYLHITTVLISHVQSIYRQALLEGYQLYPISWQNLACRS